MVEDRDCATALYPRVVGAAWEALDPAVRAAHGGGATRGRGWFSVSWGAGRLARLCARIGGLPRPGERVSVELEVEADGGGGEVWRRRFDGRPFVTHQRAARGRLIERAGLSELHFRLAVHDGALVFEQHAATLKLGPLALPLPAVLAPRVWARVSGQRMLEVEVQLSAPFLGPLCRYAGTLEILPGSSDSHRPNPDHSGQ